MKTGILFDLDGTLLDTLEDLTDSVNHALTQFGYPTRTIEEIREFVGNGAARLIQRAIPAGEDYVPVLECYQAWYRDHCQVKTGPYPGILEALAQIAQRYPIAIVSNKPDRAVKPLAKQYFGDVFALGEREDIPRKPAPDMLKYAMKELGVEACVYVGDSEVDILTAQNAGVPCVSVTWGFRDRDFLADSGARYLCDTAPRLLSAIEKAINNG